MEMIKNREEILMVDGLMTSEECREAINHIEYSIEHGLTNKTVSESNRDREDQQVFYQFTNMNATNSTSIFLERFWEAVMPEYGSRFPIIRAKSLGTLDVKGQKTHPGGGFHNFHYESWDALSSPRVLTWTIYLNDGFGGGETEFLYKNRRIEPKTGRCCLFPCSFPWTHRGNPPLHGVKYILTGWVVDLEPFSSAQSM